MRAYYVVEDATGARQLTARTQGGALEMQRRWDSEGFGPCTVRVVDPAMEYKARNIAFAIGLVAAIDFGLWADTAYDQLRPLRAAGLWTDREVQP